MTVTRCLALCTTVAAAGALLHASDRPLGSNATVPSVRLTTISAKVNGKGASLVIEASEPVSYVASRPDPLTLLLDFRNVGAEGVANSVAANAKSPIASVAVEAAESLGAPASRVRIALAQPVSHRVRSDRNTVVVDFERPSGKVPYVLPPATTSTGSTPDAMQALAQKVEPAPSDPIEALGLAPSTAPVAPSSAAATPAAPSAAPTTAPLALSAAAMRQAQPPVPPQPEIGASRGGERKFTGHPVSLDFQGADLRAVLRTFSEISGLNIVIDPAVQGTVDVALRDVPWDQALDIILAANKLGYIIDGTIVRIAPLNVLADEQSQRRKVNEEQALAGELRVLTHRLSYAKADELKDLITKSALSQRGTVQVDPRTNTLIITDLADRLTTASDLISKLDLAQPQVEIEARIVQTTKDYARALGIQWGFTGKVDPALGNTTPLAFPNKGSLTGAGGGGSTAPPAGTAVNLPVPGAPSAIGLALGSINGSFNLDVALSALENSRNGRLLSTPRVTTQNNVEAEIAQGVQVPYQTVANNTVTTSFKDAALVLKVTPQITSANTVIMRISVDKGSVGPLYNGVPSINTQRANTQVLVNDAQTTVIGGIYETNQTNTNDRTPGLGSVPLLKWLFRRDSVDDHNTELLIFITPRIIKS